MGVAIWLDDISRERLTTGNLASLARDMHVSGVTSNPTIFAKALSAGTAYADQVADLALRGVSVDEAARALTTYDIRWACDVLRPKFDASDGLNGRVSIEVDPRLARDSGKTIAEARALWWLVDRPNLFIKIPATEAGLPAITQCLSEGISINVTLIFALERYGQVIDAFFERAGEGVRPGRLHHRVGGLVLRQPGRHRGGRPARQDRHPRGARAAGQGRARQRPARVRAVRAEVRHPALGGAGGARSQAAAPALGLDQRQGPGFRRHHVRGGAGGPGHRQHDARGDDARHRGARQAARRRDSRHLHESRRVFDQLEDLGIPYDDVVQVLENEGVEKFAASWQEMLDTIKREMAAGGSTT